MKITFYEQGIHLDFLVSEQGELRLLNLSPHPHREGEQGGPAAALQITGCAHDGLRHTGLFCGQPLQYHRHWTEDREGGKDIVLEMMNADLTLRTIYGFYEGCRVVTSRSEIENTGTRPLGIEYLSSFFLGGQDWEGTQLMVPHNSWCRELNWQTYTPGQLGYRRLNEWSTKTIGARNIGAWSTKEYLPMGCLVERDRTLLWQIEHNGSWSWEISDRDNRMYLCLSGPGEDCGSWWKQLQPGESFQSVRAALAVTEEGFDTALAEMTGYRRRIAWRSPKDKSLPVIFNDYMNCLHADPASDKVLPVVEAAAQAGAEIFCMDAGWYADGTWWETVGEWEVNPDRFPHGIQEVFDAVRSHGMIPGIWLEPEVMGINCPILSQFDDSCFFVRHGMRVVDRGRYQFDFRSSKVISFLDGVVDRLMNTLGIGYFKFDYNIDPGVGTEKEADSFGDGLLACNRAYLEWISSLYKRYPNLIIENCGSGGLRMDYATLQHFSVQSMTDASKYAHIAPMAAAVSTGVIPEQSGIWAVPMKAEAPHEIAVHMVNAMFKRLQLSGEIPWLAPEQFRMVAEGVRVYKQLRHWTPEAMPFYPLGIAGFDSPWICGGFHCGDGDYLTVVRLEGGRDTLEIPNMQAPEILYPKQWGSVCTRGNSAVVSLPENSAVLLRANSID